jgi:hypothetical protein
VTAIARIDRLAYGTNQIGTARHCGDGHSYERVDTYTSDGTGEVENYRVFAADRTDDSPVFMESTARPALKDLPGAGRYNSECACCFLNFPHTEKLHNRRVAAAEQRKPVAAVTALAAQVMVAA